MHNIINILHNCLLFKGKTKEEIKNILLKLNYKVQKYKKNELIFRVDQAPAYMGIVLKGIVELKSTTSKRVISIFYREKGDVFGETDMFSDSGTYHCDIVVNKSCDILLISKSSVLEILCSDYVINSNLLKLLANNIVHLSKKLELYSFSSIRRKIAFCLLYNTEKHDIDSIDLIDSKASWAEHLNVSRTSLCRELKYLCDLGVLQITNSNIKVLDRMTLEKICEE